MKKAIFLDRDGIINYDYGYVGSPEKFELLPNVGEAIKMANDAGYLVIVITNQSGIGRGYYTLDDFSKITEKMNIELAKHNALIDYVYFCSHAPEENCWCRKPGTRMFEWAIEDFNIDPVKSWMIGDKITDIIPAKKLGIKTIYSIKNMDTLKNFIGLIIQIDKWDEMT